MSTHRNTPVFPLAPSFTDSEPVPPISNLSPDSPSDSSSGTTSHVPYEAREVKNITWIRRGEVQVQDESGHGMSINMLLDNVLLEIFDFCRKDRDPDDSPYSPVWRSWHELVHVCQRWRQIIFGSPHRLDLQILCTNGTPVRENLDCWPPLPITIYYPDHVTVTPYDEASILSALLEHPGRMHHIDLSLTAPQLEEVAAVMQEPFPALTALTLVWGDIGEHQRPSPFPNGFLGGSAPHLQYMHLEGIPFPGLPTLLSSTSNLVSLCLTFVHNDEFILPEAMVACLATLPRLNYFKLIIRCTYQMPLAPPLIQTFLPTLTSFTYHGDNRYLEEFVSWINSPQLSRIHIRYFHQYFNFQVAQLFDFIDRSEDPQLTLIRHVDVTSLPWWVAIKMHPCPESHPDWDRVYISIYCGVENQVSRAAHFFSQASTILSRVVHLSLTERHIDEEHFDGGWLHLFRQFSAVRTLRASRGFAVYVALTLEDITEDSEMVAKVLPVLDLIYLEGQPASSVEKFLGARRLSGQPVTIIDTDVEFRERVKSYVSQ